MSYTETTFKNLTDRRKKTVREQILNMWSKGMTAKEISRKVRISSRSVATAMGNLTRKEYVS